MRLPRATEQRPPRFPAGPGTENAGRAKIPAAWLIEQAGFAKGYTHGRGGHLVAAHVGARQWTRRRGSGAQQEILALANKIAAAVEARFGIRLET